MATFTTTSKSKLSWKAPVVEAAAEEGEAYEFLISDDYKLDIGGGFFLTIQPQKTQIQWTHSNKNKYSFPGTVTESEVFLDIGDGFNLNIGDGFILQIGTSERNETPWTKINKKKLTF